VRFKKEQPDDAEQEYEDEHRTFTCFSKQLEEKWEQRFEALVRLALAAGVRNEERHVVQYTLYCSVATVCVLSLVCGARTGGEANSNTNRTALTGICHINNHTS
jgi:hypothetical protein